MARRMPTDTRSLRQLRNVWFIQKRQSPILAITLTSRRFFNRIVSWEISTKPVGCGTFYSLIMVTLNLGLKNASVFMKRWLSNST